VADAVGATPKETDAMTTTARKLTLYLAGPIHGCTDEEARGWRERVAESLAARFVILDPMARDYRGREWRAPAAAIVEPDLADILRSDVVLVHPWRASAGTAMEMVYAKRLYGKYVVTVCATDQPWYIYHSSHVAPTLNDAVRHLWDMAEPVESAA
jgi:nucleoside 2-deoxyribosyltransferase